MRLQLFGTSSQKPNDPRNEPAGFLIAVLTGHLRLVYNYRLTAGRLSSLFGNLK
jgi:hypothetical protein